MKLIVKLLMGLGVVLSMTSTMAASNLTDNVGHWGVGVTTNDYAGAPYALNVNYSKNNYFADLFGNAGLGQDNGFYNAMGADIGLRVALDTPGLFASYGVLGDVSNQNKPVENVWLIGPFAGVDYQASTHILLSAKLLPYAYYQQNASYHEHQLFSNGSLTVSYLF